MSNDKLKELEVDIFTGRNICLFGLLYYLSARVNKRNKELICTGP